MKNTRELIKDCAEFALIAGAVFMVGALSLARYLFGAMPITELPVQVVPYLVAAGFGLFLAITATLFMRKK